MQSRLVHLCWLPKIDLMTPQQASPMRPTLHRKELSRRSVQMLEVLSVNLLTDGCNRCAILNDTTSKSLMQNSESSSAIMLPTCEDGDS
jgi:hypothetical protein